MISGGSLSVSVPALDTELNRSLSTVYPLYLADFWTVVYYICVCVCACTDKRGVHVRTKVVCMYGQKCCACTDKSGVHVRTKVVCMYGQKWCACTDKSGVHVRINVVCMYGQKWCACTDKSGVHERSRHVDFTKYTYSLVATTQAHSESNCSFTQRCMK